ncbi:MAG TPA: hypothetical protein VEL73_01545 [Mycobacteriales bacterium]|nr:hypothetical protein [Mycobacteriales bacterium]
MDTLPPSPDPGLEVLRGRRAELREAIYALEQALAAPAPGRAAAWAERVHVALVELSADLRMHVEDTEGPDGLHRSVVATAPRLSSAVARLNREHVELGRLVQELLGQLGRPAAGDGVDLVRERGTALLGQLVRHRQRSSDLVFEAYQADIGGET